MLDFIARAWKSSLANKIIIISGFIIFVVATTTVTWAILSKHSDKGFIESDAGNVTLPPPLGGGFLPQEA